MSPWFRENFLITRVKRPYLSFEPVSYKVSTMTGTELKGEQNLPFQNFGCFVLDIYKHEDDNITQHGERGPASAGSCQSWPHHVGCCSQVFTLTKIPDMHTHGCFQAEHCSWLSPDPGARGRQGMCRGRKY